MEELRATRDQTSSLQKLLEHGRKDLCSLDKRHKHIWNCKLGRHEVD
jgi:hypothetical protein